MAPGSQIGLGVLALVATVAGVPGSWAADAAPELQRLLYAVNQGRGSRGSVSVYDIDANHRLIKTIQTAPNVYDVKGVAASAATGRMYVSFRDSDGNGRIYCVDLRQQKMIWDRRILPGVDRLAISPDGRVLYVPTWEGNAADFINVIDAATGEVIQKVRFSNHSHDAQYPLSGPLFQETKAEDGSGRYLYRVDPRTYDVTRTGPYSDILGPYAVDSASRYVVNDVTHLWGMEVGDLSTGKIVQATLPTHPSRDPGLLHGIGWTPDEREVWQAGGDANVYVWNMRDPLQPVLSQILELSTGSSHWITFSIKGDFAYVAPEKNSNRDTAVFSVHDHAQVGAIASSEDLLEVDTRNGEIVQVGDQYGIGRKTVAKRRAAASGAGNPLTAFAARQAARWRK